MSNGRRREALHKARLTTRIVADARPRDRRHIVWDDELTGFGVRDLLLPESLVKRLVNHATSDDVTEGYAAEWTGLVPRASKLLRRRPRAQAARVAGQAPRQPQRTR